MTPTTTKKTFATLDGNEAAAHISYMLSEVAAIYPITPSSPMAEHIDAWAAQGRKNLWGQTVLVQEMQSEGGAAGALHGALQAGALTTTYTASQGLLLMIPNLYKIAGEQLPCVINVSARTLASHALSIFGDHQDVMACRQTGFALFCAGSVQEVMDLTVVPHMAALKTSIPFINFFDGFRTSHEYQKVEVMSQQAVASLIDEADIARFRKRAMSPEHPTTRGMAENPETFFAHREASNKAYMQVADAVEHCLQQVSALTGRQYHLFDYYGAPDAERVIILMGSATEAAREAIDHLMQQGERVGMIAVHLYRPFSAKHLLQALPQSTTRIAVLDRTKEPGAEGEPLYLDVRNALYDSHNKPLIVGGRYGLGSADTTPEMIVAAFDNLKLPEPKNHFTIGICDDVTFTSLPSVPPLPHNTARMFQAKFYGLGADGTVGANKNSVKIIGDNTNKYCQAYFAYDSKKSGGFTCSHLRFADTPIHATYLVTQPNFVACHQQAYLHMYDVTRGLQRHGTFLLNTIFEGKELERFIPDKVKRYFADNDIRVYYINATRIAQEIGLRNRTNTILQSAFFRITQVIDIQLAIAQMKAFIAKTYGNKGEDVVRMNCDAVDRGGEYHRLEVKAEWKMLEAATDTHTAGVSTKAEVSTPAEPSFITEVVRPINAQAGDTLPVSTFVKHNTVDGSWPVGTAAYEKRGVAPFIPQWNADHCIQCNKCAFVCPHAAIRPFVLTTEELQHTVPQLTTLAMRAPKAMEGMHFRIQVSPLDCLGCGNCADVCPGLPKKGKALTMVPYNPDDDSIRQEVTHWQALTTHVSTKQHMVDIQQSVKNSQFATPLFEFSGACAGCGETPYVKLLSQLFGDRQMIANATGCSSIYSASIPSTPYTTNSQGQGPAFNNSLFEDFCEFGLGMHIANKKMKQRVVLLLEQATSHPDCPALFKALAVEWMAKCDDAAESKRLAALLKPYIARGAEAGCPYCAELRTLDHYLVKRSQWIIGGDGASYDIGYGGLDHVIASGEDVNILVLDTEVYSNTGGQASKATPLGAIAQFAAKGKRIRKKDLGLIATTYGYVYVAQVAMGADNAQCLKALREAEAYPGPSLVIAYAPCINHGLKAKGGMGKSQAEEQRAVQCGYWHLWRYDPRRAEERLNPFQLDSKAPDWSLFHEFLMGEVRYLSLRKAFPDEAELLFAEAQHMAQERYKNYLRKAKEDYSEETAEQ